MPRGKVGEICLYGPHIVKGYLNRPDATAESIVDGWLKTGDIGYIDEDNYVYLVDRAKDMVLRGGENVYCAEVEAAIYSYPGVGECAVFSVPDTTLGEEVGASILLEHGVHVIPTEVREFLKAKLAAFKVPRYVWFLEDSLPRNAAGKILKRSLQDELNIQDANRRV